MALGSVNSQTLTLVLSLLGLNTMHSLEMYWVFASIQMQLLATIFKVEKKKVSS